MASSNRRAMRKAAPAVAKQKKRGHANLFELEPLERRLLLSAPFTAHMTAAPVGTHGSLYSIRLATTAGTANKWVVNWGEGAAQTYTNTPFALPFQPTHTYAASGTYTITATATSTTSATSTTGFALSTRFGTSGGFQPSGKTIYTPTGNSNNTNANGLAVAIDHYTGNVLLGGNPNLNDEYVASLYDGNRIAISRFTPANGSSPGGNVDTSWGPTSTQGTIVLPAFGSGTSETDVPYAVAVDQSSGGYVAVAGKAIVTSGSTTTTYWAVAVVDTLQITGTTQYGNVDWKAALTQTNLPKGAGAQANAVYVDYSDSEVIAAGTDGTHMVAAAFNEVSPNAGSLDTK